MLGFDRWQSANKGLPLGSVIDHLGGNSCSIIMSICAFYFYIIYFHFVSADHGIPQTFDKILTN